MQYVHYRRTTGEECGNAGGGQVGETERRAGLARDDHNVGTLWVVRSVFEATFLVQCVSEVAIGDQSSAVGCLRVLQLRFFEHSQAPGSYLQACALLLTPSPLFQRKYQAHTPLPTLYTWGQTC